MTAGDFQKVVFATELIFSYPQLDFDLTALISLDHLLTIPDFRIGERIFRLISVLKSRTRRKIILQTRLSEKKLFEDALSGNLSGFYQSEIQDRKIFGYPPFSRLIKLEKENHNYARLQKEVKETATLLANYAPLSLPAFIEKKKNRYRWNILLKIPTGNSRRDENLDTLLSELAQSWRITVGPESII